MWLFQEAPLKSKTISLVFEFILMFSARFVAAQSLADMARAEKAKQNKIDRGYHCVARDSYFAWAYFAESPDIIGASLIPFEV